MVNILPEAPSFGTQFARGLGAGISSGIGRGVDFAAQLGMEKAKASQRSKLLQGILGQEGGGSRSNPEEMKSKFLESLPELESLTGRELTPTDLDQAWQMFTQHHQQDKRGMPQERDDFDIAKDLAVAGEHDLSRVYTESGKSKRKESFAREMAEKERGYKESEPTRSRGRELLEDLPYKENALQTMKQSIESGNIGMLSLDNLAEMTGIEGLRSPEGATFKTASKEFFLGNLSRVGSRGLNQMMERVVLEMSPLIGRSTEANLAVTEILGAENDVTRKEAELIHQIGQDYKEKHGNYPDDLANRVYKELRPYAMQRQKDALAQIDKIKQLYEPKNKSGLLMYDPSGNLRRVPHKNKKEALQEGYRMP